MIKKVLRILLGIVCILTILLIIIWSQPVDPYQTLNTKYLRHVTRSYESKLDLINFDSVQTFVGNKKVLPKNFEKAALLALAHYPQLKNVPVIFELNDESAPMEATFVFGSLFGIGERKYRIRLNIGSNTGLDEILLYSLPFDAQVGILAHELGHVVYYDQLNLFQIAKWGIMYLIDEDFRSTHERSTDLMPIYHGLGWQIYDYAYYIRHDDSTKNLYENFGSAFIDKYYLTDKEIKKVMDEIGQY